MRPHFVQLGAWQRFGGTVEPSSRPVPVYFDAYARRFPRNSWRVELRFDGRRMTTPFFTGIGRRTVPNPCDVLETLVDDAKAYENAGTAEYWAEQVYGYESGSLAETRHRHAQFRAVERQTTKLRKFLGDDYETVLRHDDLESWCRGQRAIP